jgi:hypothetical protein
LRTSVCSAASLVIEEGLLPVPRKGGIRLQSIYGPRTGR